MKHLRAYEFGFDDYCDPVTGKVPDKNINSLERVDQRRESAISLMTGLFEELGGLPTQITKEIIKVECPVDILDERKLLFWAEETYNHYLENYTGFDISSRDLDLNLEERKRLAKQFNLFFLGVDTA